MKTFKSKILNVVCNDIFSCNFKNAVRTSFSLNNNFYLLQRLHQFINAAPPRVSSTVFDESRKSYVHHYDYVKVLLTLLTRLIWHKY